MKVEDRITNLEMMVGNLCPHKEVEVIDKSKNLGFYYCCKLCRKNGWADSLKGFRKNDTEICFVGDD